MMTDMTGFLLDVLSMFAGIVIITILLTAWSNHR